MDEKSLHKKLSDLPLGKIRFFDSIGSTNDEALAWATEGAPNLSIVIADEQTHGRGRLDRKWFTPKGTALAFSLVLRPSAAMRPHLSRIVGLAALSMADSLLKHGLTAQIKWPNDILLNGKKAAGILTETVWSGANVDSVVVGMGINVMKESVPPFHVILNFTATSIEEALGSSPDRETLLHDILGAFIARLPQIGTDALIKAWEEKLAFRGEQIEVKGGSGEVHKGELLGLEPDGSLRLRDEHGNLVTVRFGDVSLRPSA